MAEPSILFDIPSKAPQKAWSPNPWKTRLLLNFKGIDYKTQWVEYPDLKGFFEPIFTEDPPVKYTSPTVKFPDGTYVMESLAIAKAIEARYPSPSANVDSPYVQRTIDIITELFPPLTAIFFNRVATRLLNDRSREYFVEHRSKMAGMPLDQHEKINGGKVAIERCGPIVKKATAMLKENAGGPFMLGREVSYADFIWGAFLVMATRVGDDMFEEVMEMTGEREVHEALLEGISRWTKRDT